MFVKNRSLDEAVASTMEACGHNTIERVRVRLRMMLLSRRKRQELERVITEAAMAASVLPVTAVVDGVYEGRWTDFLEWFLANWESILEMILAIISLF